MILILGPTVSFNEGGILIEAGFVLCNSTIKTNLLNIGGVDFFILADVMHYFICQLDVYQGKDLANIDIKILSFVTYPQPKTHCKCSIEKSVK